MSEFENPDDHILLAAEFVPGTNKYPAMLDLAWYNEDKGKNEYVTLQGAAAKKLSHLKQGDIYHAKVES